MTNKELAKTLSEIKTYAKSAAYSTKDENVCNLSHCVALLTEIIALHLQIEIKEL